jgi:hypothetical protein
MVGAIYSNNNFINIEGSNPYRICYHHDTNISCQIMHTDPSLILKNILFVRTYLGCRCINLDIKLRILQVLRLPCIHKLSYCTKLSSLQLVGPISTHLTDYCTELSILQVIRLIFTYLTSCCMMSAIKSYLFVLVNIKKG